MKIDWKRSVFIYVLILLIALALLQWTRGSQAPKMTEIDLSQAITMSQEHKIAKIEVNGVALKITDKEENIYKTVKEDGVSIYEITGMDLDGVEILIKDTTSISIGIILLNILPYLIFGLFLFMMFRQASRSNNQAMSFGKMKTKQLTADKNIVTFKDVAGVDEAKQDLQEIVEFLKDREKFQKMGARIPRGVLLVGPPGTGKTLIAKAVAGEAGVPFFALSGSEFVEMFVGVGASRVRDLFGEAKKAAPCIIFIDEIDAVGRQRGAGLGGGHDEREQTLNQILVEMDGFETDQSIIVMAATNRPDILDPALMRPGRFDRRVILGRPDVKGREAILKVHAKDKPFESNINFNIIAKLTSGFSGADLQNLLNEAAILAARRNKSLIGMPEIEESIDRVLFGPERKSHKVTDKEKKVTAYHEAGHAIVALILPHADNPRKVTVIPRGMALGYTKPLSEDKDVNTLEQLQDSIAMAMGGRVAEELVFNEISTGASSDIKKATEIAVSMVTEYGMSKLLGPRSFGKHDDMVFLGREISEQRDYGEETANAIDAEVKRIVTEGYESAVKTLTEHRDLLDKLAEGLLEYETLEGEELYKVLGVEMPENMKLLEKEIEEIKNEFGITDGPKAEEPKDEAPAAGSETPKDETETPAE